jgi:class 3 adenylate cyclase
MAGTDERKPVTVLVADLAGSMELATRHDPEHLRALLPALFDEMGQHIETVSRSTASGWASGAELTLARRE